jgi:hypothetical protein
MIENSTQSTNLDIWNDAESATSTMIPVLGTPATIRSISTENMPIRTSSNNPGKAHGAMADIKEPPRDASLDFDYNPAIVDYVSSGRVQNPRSLRRRNMSSTSTIFKNSPLTPITIIVTTPEEQNLSPPPTQPQNPFNAIRAHRQSSSLPSSRLTSSSTPNLIPDSSRLKPPTEQQINASKLSKAHEFREIRKFLISFINAKGDQFPKKLRYRMMEMYCITSSDLAPETVAKFTDEIRDEGVALEQLGISEPEATDLDDLRILQMAFMSQIPLVTPSKERKLEDPKPISRTRKQSLIGRRAEARKDDAPISWLALTTNSSLAAPPLDSPPPRPFVGEHKLLRASSVPNLREIQEIREDVPPIPSMPSAYTTNSPVKRSRNNTLSASSNKTEMLPVEGKPTLVEKEVRSKRGNVIMGAFGAVRDAIAASKEARARERRRLLKDAIL